MGSLFHLLIPSQEISSLLLFRISSRKFLSRLPRQNATDLPFHCLVTKPVTLIRVLITFSGENNTVLSLFNVTSKVFLWLLLLCFVFLLLYIVQIKISWNPSQFVMTVLIKVIKYIIKLGVTFMFSRWFCSLFVLRRE